jgi:CelD/BcsL family acetyltransferase involved in cellulose biosynthesis
MKPGVDVMVLRSAAEMTALLPEWRELFEFRRTELPVFAHPAFVSAWIGVYGDQIPWRCVVVRDSVGGVELILPFVEAQRGVWHLLGSGEVDYQFVLERGNTAAPWIRLKNFFQRQREVREWAIRHLPEPSSWHWQTEIWNAPQVRTWEHWSRPGPLGLWKQKREHHFLRGPRLLAAADKLQSDTMRRYRHWFEKRGGLEHVTATTPVSLEKYLPALFDLHVREWAWRGQTSEFVSAEARAFYRELARGLSEDGVARLDGLKWNGTLVSAHFGFVWRETMHYYKPAFDPDYRSRSPGTLLLRQMLRSTVEEGLEEFDFLAGRESYKSDYSPEIRPTSTLRLFRNRRALVLTGILSKFL